MDTLYFTKVEFPMVLIAIMMGIIKEYPMGPTSYRIRSVEEITIFRQKVQVCLLVSHSTFTNNMDGVSMDNFHSSCVTGKMRLTISVLKTKLLRIWFHTKLPVIFTHCLQREKSLRILLDKGFPMQVNSESGIKRGNLGIEPHPQSSKITLEESDTFPFLERSLLSITMVNYIQNLFMVISFPLMLATNFFIVHGWMTCKPLKGPEIVTAFRTVVKPI